MRKFLLLVSVLALLVPGLLFPGTAAAHAAPPVPYEEARFARVAADLAKDRLYVDMDLADVIDGSMRTALRGVMTRTSQALGVPVYFVAIPNDDYAESYGKSGAFLAGLNAHLRRDGLYLMTDADGDIGYAAYGVPRKLRSTDLLSIAISSANDHRRPFDDLVPRATHAMDEIVNATAGPPSTETYDTGVPPIGQENPPLEVEFWGPFTGGLLLCVPDGRRHYTVPGRWQRGAFGARRPDLPADVLESLGVHD